LAAKAQNHYEILGLWRDASDTEIRRAYRHLAILHHPDVSSNPGAGERFRAIKEAYDVLSDPSSRLRYDSTLGADITSPTRPQTGSRTDWSAGVPGGWTPPWVRDWNVETWLQASADPPLWSARAVWAEMRRSRRSLAGYFAVLMLVIAVCALLDRAIPELGTIVIATVFSLPFFIHIFSTLRAGREPAFSVRRGRRLGHRPSDTPAAGRTRPSR
jgi:hypothetical protein